VVRVYVILDDRTSPEHPLGDAVDILTTREDAERFVEDVRGDDTELVSYLRSEERALEAGGSNEAARPTIRLAAIARGRLSSRTAASTSTSDGSPRQLLALFTFSERHLL
jgi:hypothetical protein